MSRNGTANQEAAILRAIRASVGGSFRDTERSAGGAPGRAAPGWPQIYVGAVVIAGCGALSKALMEVTAAPPSVEWWVLAALTLLSGTAVLKVPAIPANFSISDVFTLTAAVAFGPAAGTVAVALDSLAISARLARSQRGLRPERLLFNCAAPPLAMWLSAQVIFATSGLKPL